MMPSPAYLGVGEINAHRTQGSEPQQLEITAFAASHFQQPIGALHRDAVQ